MKQEVLDGLWSGHSVTCTNSNGEKFMIETEVGIRGRNNPVKVFFEGDNCLVIEKEREIKVIKVVKLTQ